MLEDSTGKRFSHLQITLDLNLQRFREGVLNIIQSSEKSLYAESKQQTTVIFGPSAATALQTMQ